MPHATIVDDYVLTNEYLRGEALISVRKSSGGSAASKITANPAALDAAFDEVTEQYGTFERYLHDGLQLSDGTLAALRRNFLAG